MCEKVRMGLNKHDYMVLVAWLLFIVSHSATQFMAGYMFDATQSNSVAKMLEANPLLAYAAFSKKISILLVLVFLPAILGSFYYIVRRSSVMMGEYNMYEYMAALFVLVALTNMTNDISLLLGLLA